MPTVAGEPLAEVELDGGPRLARLLTWLPGSTWAQTAPHVTPGRGPAALRELGALVARVDAALAGFRHPAADRPLRWNLATVVAPGTDARDLLPQVPDPERRAVAAAVLDRFADRVAPALGALAAQPIHNDANDLNVLVDRAGRVRGLIDFGDLCTAPRICGLAVACSYVMALPGEGPDGGPFADPVRAVLPLVAGYHAVSPLRPDELALLLDLVRTRLALSIVMAGWQHANDPGNDYLLVSQEQVWQLLQRLQDPRTGDDDLSLFRFRDACGYEADPRSRAVRSYLAGAEVAPVVGDRPLADLPHLVFDFTAGAADRPMTSQAVADAMAAAGAEIGLGRYLEHRDVYATPAFAGTGPDDDRRTVHLAVDLFAPAGTPVRTPLPGTVHAFADNDQPLDYGPVVVVRHRTDDGTPFFTLYGHLSRESLPRLSVGMPLAAGDVVATMGAEHENGSWPPHVHLQLLTSLAGLGLDVPGVARRSELGVWRSISPDPNLVLRLPSGLAATPPLTAEQIAARRAVAMSPALSLSYREPLHVVAAHGARLVDADGREWLDLVNNVAHVGHAHPRVVAAAARQHGGAEHQHPLPARNVVEYAERLAATLPDPLSVCFFVNSGSEANDLALRLAHAHTGSREMHRVDVAYHGNLTSLIEISPYKFNGPGGAGAPTHVHVVADARTPTGGAAPAATAPASGRRHAAHRRPDARWHGAGAGRAAAAGLHRGVDPRLRRADRAAPTASCARGLRGGAGRRRGVHRRRGAGRLRPGRARTSGPSRLQGVVPDIVTMGKPIGNGHPLGAVVTTPEIAAAFANGMEYFNTFGGNPVSCAIGLAVLDVIEDERLQSGRRGSARRLLAGLRGLAGRHPLVGDVRGARAVPRRRAGPRPDHPRAGAAAASALVANGCAARHADLHRRPGAQRAEDQAAAGPGRGGLRRCGRRARRGAGRAGPMTEPEA